MPRNAPRYVPAVVLGIGCVLLLRIGPQQAVPLRAPLAGLPQVLFGMQGTDRTISQAEQEAAGMSEYLLRTFETPTGAQLSIYVGYYPSQTQGRTVHSPKNCLPGSGWEPLAARQERLAVAGQEVPVNRYELANGDRRALVYYWYQGRGRVAANEYAVKFDLLRDAALHGRTEETLVRVVVPLNEGLSDSAASRLARDAVGVMIPEIWKVLPL